MENNETERNDTIGTEAEKGEAAPGPKRRPVWLLAAVGVIIIVVLAVVFTSGSSPGGGGLAVSIDAPAAVDAGSDFIARVEIGEVVSLDSANYDIEYDPDVLEVVKIANGSINATAVPIAAWQFVPTGIQGAVRIINNVPGIAGLNGSGYLAEVHFQVVGSSGDESSLVFTGAAGVFDNYGEPMDATWVGGSVSVR